MSGVRVLLLQTEHSERAQESVLLGLTDKAEEGKERRWSMVGANALMTWAHNDNSSSTLEDGGYQDIWEEQEQNKRLWRRFIKREQCGN